LPALPCYCWWQVLFSVRPHGGRIGKSVTLLFNEWSAVIRKGRRRREESRDFSAKRLAHELQMLRNPITGTIPANIQEIETKVLKSIPQKKRQ
jgi:hypothetical protein